MDLPSIQETLSRTLGTAAPRGQKGPIPPFGHLCSSPAFVPGPCAPSQPARQPSPLALAWRPASPPHSPSWPLLTHPSARAARGGVGSPAHRAGPAPSPLPAGSPACHPAPSSAHAPRRAAPRTISPLRPLPTSSPFAPALQSRESGVISPRSPPSRLLPRPLRLSSPPASAPSRSLTLSLSRCPPLSPPPLCFSGELAPRDSSHTAVPLVRRQRRRGERGAGTPGAAAGALGGGQVGTAAVRRGASRPGAAGAAVTVPAAPAVSRSRGQRSSRWPLRGANLLGAWLLRVVWG